MARVWHFLFLACLPVAVVLALGQRWLAAAIVFLLGAPLFWTLRNHAVVRPLSGMRGPSHDYAATGPTPSGSWTHGTKEKALGLTLGEGLELGGLLFEFWKRNQPPRDRNDSVELDSAEAVRLKLISAHAAAVDRESDSITVWLSQTEVTLLYGVVSATLRLSRPENPVAAGMLRRLDGVRDRLSEMLQ